VLIVDTEDGLGQRSVECSYSVRSSLGKTRGRKTEFLERIVPLGELYTLE